MKGIFSNATFILIVEGRFTGLPTEFRNMSYEESETLKDFMRQKLLKEDINLVITAGDSISLQTEHVLFNDADKKIKAVTLKQLSLLSADVDKLGPKIIQFVEDFTEKSIFDFVLSKFGEKITKYVRKALPGIQSAIGKYAKEEKRIAIIANQTIINALYHILPGEEGHHDNPNEMFIQPGEVIKITYYMNHFHLKRENMVLVEAGALNTTVAA